MDTRESGTENPRDVDHQPAVAVRLEIGAQRHFLPPLTTFHIIISHRIQPLFHCGLCIILDTAQQTTDGDGFLGVLITGQDNVRFAERAILL